MKLNYEQILLYQKFWKESEELSQQRKDGLIDLSNKFIKRVRNNADEVDNVTLRYPEDCSDFSTFCDFAYAMNANVTVMSKDGAEMHNWGLNYEIEIE